MPAVTHQHPPGRGRPPVARPPWPVRQARSRSPSPWPARPPPPPWPPSACAASALVSRTGTAGLAQQLDHDGGALLGRLARSVDRLGDPLAQGPVVVDPGEAQVGEGQAPQPAGGVVGRAGARRPRRRGVGGARARPSGSLSCPGVTRPATSIAFFGPAGTFTEEALLTEPDLAAAVLEPRATITEVLEAVASGEVDLGFVPMENAIDGTVRDTLDALILDFDLLIQREVVLDVHLHLMAPPGTKLADDPPGAVVPGGAGPVPEVPRRAPARRRAGGRQLHRRRRPPARRARRAGHGGHRARGWPPTSTACRCWSRTWRTIPATRPGSWRWPDRGSRAPPATTGPASSASSGPTARAACTGSSASSPPATST